MLETGHPDLSYRALLQEGSRRRDRMLDEFRERVAGLLAIGLVALVPLWAMMPRSDVSMAEASEAAEPAAGSATFMPPLLNQGAVLNRLEANRVSASDIRALQSELKQRGFNPGPVDGVAGERTLSALNRYRKSVHLAPVPAVSHEAIAALPSQ